MLLFGFGLKLGELLLPGIALGVELLQCIEGGGGENTVIVLVSHSTVSHKQTHISSSLSWPAIFG